MQKTRKTIRLMFLLGLLGLISSLSACGRSMPLDDGDVVAIRVRPENPSMYIEQILQLTVEAHMADGSVSDVTLSPGLLLRLNKAGLVRLLEGGRLAADNAGQVQLLAAYGGKEDRVDIEVRYALLDGISVVPDIHQMQVGDVVQLSVTGQLSDSTEIDLSLAAAGTSYTSNQPEVATATEDGLIFGLAAGMAHVTVRHGEFSADARIEVGDDTRPIVSVELQPDEASLQVGGSLQLYLIGNYEDGATVNLTADPDTSFVSSAPTLLSVDESGLATGLSPGEALVTASFRSFEASSLIGVTDQGMLVGIEVEPRQAALNLGAQLQLNVRAVYDDGRREDVSQLATYRSSSPAIVQVDVSGLLRAAGAGQALVTARYEGYTDVCEVQVSDRTLVALTIISGDQQLEVSEQFQLEVEGRFDDGTTADLSSFASGSRYSSNDEMIAAVGPNGLVNAIRPGMAEISVSNSGLSDSIQIEVTGPEVTEILFLPPSMLLQVGELGLFDIWANYSDGSSRLITQQALTSVSDNRIIELEEPGQVRGGAEGLAQVSASYAGFSAAMQVEVAPRQVVAFWIEPNQVDLEPGGQFQLAAWASFSDGGFENVSAFAAWTTDNNGVAGVSPLGLVTANGGGTTQVSANYQSFDASSTIRVTVGPQLIGIDLQPDFLSLLLGESAQMRVFALYDDNTAVEVTDLASFELDNPTVIILSPGGYVDSVAPGHSQVTARYQGFADSSLVEVAGPVLIGVRVTPGNVLLDIGDAANLRAWADYDDGSSLEVTNLASWETSDLAVASVAPGGQVTALSGGIAFISAWYGGLRGQSRIQVEGGPAMIGLRIVPDSASLYPGDGVALQAFADYDDGSSHDVTDLAHWATSDPTVADVAPNGQVNALAPGTAYISAAYQGHSDQATILVNEILHPVPSLSSLNPNQVRLGISGQSLTVPGGGFDSASVLRIDGANQATTFIDGGTLQVILPDWAVASLGQREIRVFNPAPGGGLSNALQLTVVDVPDIFTISPDSGMQGTAVRVALYGQGLYGCGLSATDPAIGISQISYSADGRYLFATLSIAMTASVGPSTLTASNAAGADNITFRVIEDQQLENLTVASYDEIWLSGVQAYHNITINTGAIVHGAGDEPLQFLATGQVRIYGSIDVSGERGEDGYYNPAAGGDAGAGGGGGGGGGDGDSAIASQGGAGTPPGEDSTASQIGPGTPAGDGGGTGHGIGASGGCGQGGSGGGFGGAGGAAGGDLGIGTGAPGGNANSIGSDFNGGVGGGGGSTCGPNCGGGGGGGGGVLVIASMSGDIEILGSLRADGGDGGNGYNGTGSAGGGSGGRITITSAGNDILIEDTLSAQGGIGGQADAGDAGGGGGGGRIVLDTGGGSLNDSFGIYDVRGGSGGEARDDHSGYSGLPGDDGIVDLSP
ncbi:MAG: Ig-like domain-containing protein [Deltaproteobacteria bacterium]|nr:Ig-like domain-containing protein [Deltaproteobacteria bacterium]